MNASVAKYNCFKKYLVFNFLAVDQSEFIFARSKTQQFAEKCKLLHHPKYPRKQPIEVDEPHICECVIIAPVFDQLAIGEQERWLQIPASQRCDSKPVKLFDGSPLGDIHSTSIDLGWITWYVPAMFRPFPYTLYILIIIWDDIIKKCKTSVFRFSPGRFRLLHRPKHWLLIHVELVQPQVHALGLILRALSHRFGVRSLETWSPASVFETTNAAWIGICVRILHN